MKANPSIPFKSLIAENEICDVIQESLKGKTKGTNNTNQRLGGII